MEVIHRSVRSFLLKINLQKNIQTGGRLLGNVHWCACVRACVRVCACVSLSLSLNSVNTCPSVSGRIGCPVDQGSGTGVRSFTSEGTRWRARAAAGAARRIGAEPVLQTEGEKEQLQTEEPIFQSDMMKFLCSVSC